ncbi:MAG: cytochrome b [Sneathiellales bacterium]|nr:cytochrome b [Sneathiellales bacterium]
MILNSETRYGLVSKSLHWLIALSIISLIVLGWWMVGLSYYDQWYHQSLEIHRALGMLVLLLASLFLIWKIFAKSPPLQSELTALEKLGAKTAHILLLVSMFTIPVTGYVISTSAGAAFTFFGLFDIPAVTQISEASRELAITIHYYAAYCVGILALVHAGAALKHQFIDKHGTLRRML